MLQEFNTLLLNDDGSYRTQTINGVPDIVVHSERQVYTYDEICSIVATATYLERIQYGWEVRFIDSDGSLNKLFIRSSELEKVNLTTSSKESVTDWINKLYDLDIKQMNLF